MTTLIRHSPRLARLHFHPYVLCIIDMQPTGFSNANFIIDNVTKLVLQAMLEKAFIVVAQYKGCGETHVNITRAIQKYPYKEYLWHTKNDKSKPIQEALQRKHIFTRQLKICGVNTEYCVKDTVHGLAKKFPVMINVVEQACHGTDRCIEQALHKMRTFYKNVAVC
jgi:nicotinamidase-related amidase